MSCPEDSMSQHPPYLPALTFFLQPLLQGSLNLEWEVGWKPIFIKVVFT